MEVAATAVPVEKKQTDKRSSILCSQMKWRLREGQGEAIYEIGVEDNGLMTGNEQCSLCERNETSVK